MNWRQGGEGLVRTVSGTMPRRFLLCLVSGALAALAMPPVFAIFMLVPGFGVFLWLIHESNRAREAFWQGWWFGLGHFSVGIYWIGNALLTYPERYGWLAPFAVLGLAAVLALFPAMTALVTRRYSATASGVGKVLFFSAAWSLFEWVRGWIFTGFPWNMLGSVWAFSDTMLQTASWSGVLGLGLITVYVAVVPLTLIPTASWKSGFSPSLVAVALIAMCWGLGTFRISDAPAQGEDLVNDVRLRLVQPNIDQQLKWRGELRLGHVREQVRLSALPPAHGELPPTHVIWAETAAPYAIANMPDMLKLIASGTPQGGLTITGAPRTTPRDANLYRVYNSLHAVDDKGVIKATYDKHHLVPFGEYIPFRRILRFSKLTAGQTDFTPGPGAVTLNLEGLPAVAPLICYEVIFSGRVINRTGNPQWMLNLTNDGWYGLSSGPYQHFVAARLRAVEEGIPLVRVANTGISGVIDSFGRTLVQSRLGEKTIIDAGLPKALIAGTVYGRLGDSIPLIMMLMAFVVSLVLPARRLS